MATINPSESLTRGGSLSGAVPRPSIDTSTPLMNGIGSGGSGAQKSQKGAQRVDLEPLYANLKNSIGERWPEYKEYFTKFCLGAINQSEFNLQVASLFSSDSKLPHYHNQLLCGLLSNASRDVPPPEPGVATWVAANDKPATGGNALGAGAGGKGGGASGDDEADRRLKQELMALPPRDRRRIKGIPQPEEDPTIQVLNDFLSVRQIKVPDAVPASAGGFNKTNWELEIRKHYTQPLFSEAHEFPDKDTIAARMLPIAYEEGLPGGCSTGSADFVTVAVETVTKALLEGLFQRTRSNGRDYIKTAKFKRRLEREEDAWLRGEVTKTPAGLLPVEVEASQKHRPVTMEDVRLSVEMGDRYLQFYPMLTSRYITPANPWGQPDDVIGDPMDIDGPGAVGGEVKRPDKPTLNGIGRVPPVNGLNGLPNGMPNGLINGMTNGYVNGSRFPKIDRHVDGVHVTFNTSNIIGEYREDNEEDECGWAGGSMHERKDLSNVLDEVLGSIAT